MTLENLYRDIFSKLSLSNEENRIYKNDIVDEINDVIRVKRIEYASRGMGNFFEVTETVNSFGQDPSFPFVQSDVLTNKIIDEVPLNIGVFSVTGKTVTTDIPNSIASFSKGSLAVKDNKVYKAVEQISSINSYTLTFSPKNVRNYYRANGLNYTTGEVLRDNESGSYYKVNSDFSATQNTDADSIAELDKLYWREVGSAYVYVSVYPYTQLRDLKLFNDLPNTEAITIKDNKIYCTNNLKEVTLTYIPKWTDVTTFATNIPLPDFMIQDIKYTCVQNLAKKLGIEMQLEEDGDVNRDN